MEWSGQKTNLSLTFIKRYDRAGHRDKIPVKDLALLASLTRDTKYNYSIIRSGEKTGLSPAYDLLNTTIVLRGGAEEIALRLAGKKRNLNRKDLIDYFGKERCGLTGKVIESNLLELSQAKEKWYTLLDNCFLSEEFKEKYAFLMDKRIKVLEL